ncbi:OsmC family protein [Lactobacillus sp. PV034]|uniref:OsmC family protein n=1 Tax=Lactobacillus sp. PV034 TaxID=2594495 RepID=UPI00223FEAC3|nr:OsmC family protein [Lactobacillus sp. PV034]QNQ80199.1 OsmC family protein [Lactobacillus sp. PV034]
MSEYNVESEYSSEPWGIDNSTQRYSFVADEGKGKGPNPVEYLTGAVNSCLSISAAMLIAHRKLDIKNFKINNTAHTRKLEHGMSDVARMDLVITFESKMSQEQQDAFVKRMFEVSTVYQTIAKAVKMDIKVNP